MMIGQNRDTQIYEILFVFPIFFMNENKHDLILSCIGQDWTGTERA